MGCARIQHELMGNLRRKPSMEFYRLWNIHTPIHPHKAATSNSSTGSAGAWRAQQVVSSSMRKLFWTFCLASTAQHTKCNTKDEATVLSKWVVSIKCNHATFKIPQSIDDYQVGKRNSHHCCLGQKAGFALICCVNLVPGFYPELCDTHYFSSGLIKPSRTSRTAVEGRFGTLNPSVNLNQST